MPNEFRPAALLPAHGVFASGTNSAAEACHEKQCTQVEGRWSFSPRDTFSTARTPHRPREFNPNTHACAPAREVRFHAPRKQSLLGPSMVCRGHAP